MNKQHITKNALRKPESAKEEKLKYQKEIIFFKFKIKVAIYWRQRRSNMCIIGVSEEENQSNGI